MDKGLRNHADAIVKAAIGAVQPDEAVRRALSQADFPGRVMLVSAFAGRDHVLNAYRTAVEEKYRFFSFGDAMCIL